MSKHGIISPDDEKTAEYEVKGLDEVILNLDKIALRATASRLVLRTEIESELPVLFDYAEGIFAILSSLSITAAGFNSSAHYDVKTEKEWHRLGHKMAPKEPWFAVMPASPLPGLISIAIQGARTDEFSGARNITFESSKKLKFGVFININEHVSISSSSGEGEDDGVSLFIKAARYFRENLARLSSESERKILE